MPHSRPINLDSIRIQQIIELHVFLSLSDTPQLRRTDATFNEGMEINQDVMTQGGSALGSKIPTPHLY